MMKSQNKNKIFIMPFSGDELDHAETRRTPEELEFFIKQDNAQCLCIYNGSVAINIAGGLKLIHPSKLIGKKINDPGPIFLGIRNNTPIFSASLVEPGEIKEDLTFEDLRKASKFLSPQGMSVAGRAKSLLDWHINNRFCSKCGQITQPSSGGIKRECNRCSTEHFPRVNPVVIMLIISNDKVLLGRGKGWPEGAMSALAGFISPGETIEEAVKRETYEEVGIKIKNAEYIFSQPWPWPSQLMIGMICEAESEDLNINTDEIEEAKWFKKDQVKAVYDNSGDHFLRLPKFTIAHHLLRNWIDS